MRKSKTVIAALIGAVMLAGCVSKSEYDEKVAELEKLRTQVKDRKITVARIYYGNGRNGPQGVQINADQHSQLGPTNVWRKHPACGDANAMVNAMVVPYPGYDTAQFNYYSVVCETGLELPS